MGIKEVKQWINVVATLVKLNIVILLNTKHLLPALTRGIKNMVENDRYCVDILTQVSAVQSALNSFNKVLLSQHIKTCVVDDIKSGNEEVVDELLNTIQKIMK